MINSLDKIIIWYKYLNTFFLRIKLGSERTVTVVQCHPLSNTLAIGDNTGRVVLYYNVMHKIDRSQTVYHWHTLPVNDVIFTSSGKLLRLKFKIGSDLI